MMRRRVIQVSTARVMSERRLQSTEDVPPPEADPIQIEDPISTLAKSAVDTSSAPVHVDAPAGRFADYVANEAASTLYRNALSDFDPFGGLAREDYFRDPAYGNEPRYAPRDFVHGGVIDHAHSLTPTRYTLAQARISALSGDVAEYRHRSSDVRSSLREAPPKEAANYLREESSAHLKSLTHSNRMPADTAFNAAFAENSVFRAAHTAVPSPADQVQAARRHAAKSNAFIGELTLHPSDLETLTEAKEATLLDVAMTEDFRQIHGLADRDAYEEDRVARRQQHKFRGYDPSTVGGARIALPNVISPASMAEAQTALRQNIVDAPTKVTATILAANTSAAEPAIGPNLASRLEESVTATQRAAAAERQQQFRAKFGFGRQGLLVTDNGPDQRVQQLHKNDERLYRAAAFDYNEYRDGDIDPKDDTINHQRVARGVGHLLTNKFDVDRRAHMLAQGRKDPVERSEMHYGVPIKQAIDHRVRFGGGRAFERHFEYFTPFPTPRDMQLYELHSDVAGFPLFQRKNFSDRFEFELFERYRAHHQQRRRLALKHGLEPRASETVGERNARRAKLDRLCEQTPFDEKLMTPPRGPNPNRSSADVLRQWFGAYWLPSPTLASQMLGSDLHTGLHLVDVERKGLEDLHAIDRREHLLSSRYINCLLTVDVLNNRLLRGYIKDALTACPEVELTFRQQNHVLKHFTPEQRRMYDEYVASETERHLQLWQQVLSQRRYVASSNSYGVAASFFESEVVTVRSVADGTVTVVSKEAYDIAAAAADAATGVIKLDDVEVVPVHPTTYVETANPVIAKESFVTVKIEGSNEAVVMPESEWNGLPEEHPSPDPNQHIHGNGTDRPSYNRVNYIEAQDFIWESRTSQGVEGWTQALSTDALPAGTPILARRQMNGRVGELERAEVVQFHTQPFFNPDKKIRVKFALDDAVMDVPLATASIWQASPDGPDRTELPETREYISGARHVDVADPKSKRQIVRRQTHFLDKYAADTRAARATAKFRRSRDVRELDEFNRGDMTRSENHRLLSAVHRTDYVGQDYFHRYTPWEYIVHMESETPQIIDQIRHDDVGPAYFHAPNRYWLRKRRPFGEIKYFYNEVRDFFQFVDGITPWDAAKKIRTHWEVREHHPTPYYNRPNLAMHRNTAAILPSHLWEADKRTGVVKALKDSVKGYRPTVKAASWIEK